MTDFRALCAELIDDLEMSDWPSKLKETFRADIDRARAALAEQPVWPPMPVPGDAEGLAEVFWNRYDQPEPVAPTDEELLQIFDTVCLSEGGTVDEIHLRGLRAVLARWGQS
jgi:hypothetical protein